MVKGSYSDFCFRTPGYPAFLALTKLFPVNPEALAVAIQYLLSSLCPILIALIFYPLVGNWATVVGCVYFIDVQSALVSSAILTESLTHTLVLLATVSCIWVGKKITVTRAVVAGLILLFLVMVRPAFLPLAILAPVALLASQSNWTVRRIASLSLVAFVPAMGVTAWAYEIKRETGTFTLSHITGVALINQVDPKVFFSTSDLAPIELKNRLQTIYETDKSFENIGWKIVKQDVDNGLPPWTSANGLKDLAVSYILRHPAAYAIKVDHNAYEFWTGDPSYVYADSNALPYINKSLLGSLSSAAAQLLWSHPGVVIKLLFLLQLGYLLLYLVYKDATVKLTISVLFSVIAVCMLGHILFNGADLARYRVPIQSLFLCSIVALPIAVFQQVIRVVTPAGRASGSSR